MSSSRTLGAISVAALVVGLGLALIPPMLRDGICGLTGCADQVPDVAVTRSSAAELAVLVPGATASEVSRIRLLQGGNSGSQEWVVERTAPSQADAYVFGSRPPGFETLTPLTVPVQEGAWVVEVRFACTTASLPFAPDSIGVGQVRSWQGVTEGAGFSEAARTTERCATDRDTPESALLILGAVLATAGAVLGIVVVLRRPLRDPDDPGDWAPTAEQVAARGPGQETAQGTGKGS